MRFERKNHEERIKTLYRLHKHINCYIFNNKLKEIKIDICNKSTNEFEKWGNFNPYEGKEINFETMEIKEMPQISITPELVDDLEELKTQREQVILLGSVMLHEMIHQYMYENNIDDCGGHGGKWEETAAKFGLISIYDGETHKTERLSEQAIFAICLFEMK